MNDLTRGPVTRHLLALSAFMAVSMLFQTLFQIRDVWHLSVVSVAIQAALILLLLQREFRRRLAFAPVPVAEAVPDRIGVEDADGTGAIG